MLVAGLFHFLFFSLRSLIKHRIELMSRRSLYRHTENGFYFLNSCAIRLNILILVTVNFKIYLCRMHTHKLGRKKSKLTNVKGFGHNLRFETIKKK